MREGRESYYCWVECINPSSRHKLLSRTWNLYVYLILVVVRTIILTGVLVAWTGFMPYFSMQASSLLAIVKSSCILDAFD